MGLTIAFKLAGGGFAGSLPVNTSGFYRFGPGLPDVFAWYSQDRLCLVLANGCVEVLGKAGSNSTIVGTFTVTGGGVAQVPPTKVDLRYGCAEVVRLGVPTSYTPPEAWDAWWLRHMPTDPKAIVDVVQRLTEMDFSFDDTPFMNPDQSGSARVCQSAWAGTLAAALNIDRDRVRKAAEQFVDFQLRWRHALYYDNAGATLRAHENPWWRVSPSGWDGAVKITVASPYKFETTQHLAPDILFALAVGFDDFAARLYLDAYVESVLTRPEFRESQTADDQRSHGYCMRLAALWTLGELATPERDAALERVVSGWRSANGFAFTGEPYPSIAPTHTGAWSHGYPSLVDWQPYSKANNLVLPESLPAPTPGGTCDHLRTWLTAMAVQRNLAKNSYTDGPNGLWQGATVVWQTGVALGALCAIRDVPAAALLVPDIHPLIQHSAACITGPGSRPGIGPTGITLQPNPFQDSYVSRNPKRVAAGGGKNGTSTWLINPLLAAEGSCGENLAAKARTLAELEWTLTDFPSPPDLETTGLLPIRELGMSS